MSFFIKHRPKEFKEFIGNSSIVKSVKSLVEKKEVPHSWMFTGNSGCGKTTLARLVAKTLGAKPSAIFEINASDMRGIDGVRDILSTIAYASPGSPVKVYILDECHQLTKDAQNALLKSLEDAPNHVYFILCTTDPQKLISTIRTRCKEFKLKPLGEDAMLKLLMETCEKESKVFDSINFQTDVYSEIISAAGGSPRLALNMLEKAVNAKTIDEVRDLISGLGIEFQGEGDFVTAKKICDILLRGDSVAPTWHKIAKILDEQIFAQRMDIPSIKVGITNILGRSLLRKGKSKVADAVLLLEKYPNFYSNASFAALLYKMVSIICSES